MLSIGQVARQAGLSTATLRYYEAAGVLAPPARRSGQRRYAQNVFQQLALIKLAQQAGFTIAEIRTLQHGFPADMPAGERWRALANPKRAAVEAMLQRALEMHNTLEQISRCDCQSLDQCAC